MDIKQLTTYVTIAQTLNYQKAARSLQYSPSTLFKHIQLLEEEVGVPLLEKEGRKLVLTPEGERFLIHAKEMLRQYDAMVADMESGGAIEGVLSVGGCEINMNGGVSELLRRYSERYKSVRIDLMTAANANVPMLVRSGMIDLGFYYCTGDEQLQGLQTEFLYQEPAYLLASPDSRLAKEKGLHYSDLTGARIAYTHDSCCLIIELLRRLRSAGVEIGEVVYLGSLQLALEAAGDRETLMLLPRNALERLEKEGTALRLDLDEEPIWAWETILWREDEVIKPSLRAMIRHSMQTVRPKQP